MTTRIVVLGAGTSSGKIVEVFADIACPFTHVGLRRFVERRRDAHRDDVRLWIRAWPLELVNGEPLDPQLIDEEVRELRAQVAPDLFAGFRPDRFPHTSLPALSLATSAYERGLELGERVSLGLRWALFEQGRDISDPRVLSDVAQESGMASHVDSQPDHVIRDWHDGQRRGVVGSPYFVLGGAGFFCPSLAIARHDGHLEISQDEDGLQAFLAKCFDEPAVVDQNAGQSRE